MEYLIGSLVTTFIFLYLQRLIAKNPQPKYSILHTQSNTYSLLAPYRPFLSLINTPPPLVTQATKHYDKQHTRIVFADDKAYWIENNAFVEADLVDGIVHNETKKAVDVMNMDKIELEKMAFIVDRLTKGKINDSGDSGQ